MRAFKSKEKPKPLAGSKPSAKQVPPSVPKTPVLDDLADFGNRVMQKLFGVSKNWYKERDILKNNYALGVEYFRRGSAKDAILRFKMVTWLDKENAMAWHYLGRAYLMDGKRAQATSALKKSLALNSGHEDTKILLKSIPLIYDAGQPPVKLWKVGEEAVSVLEKIHQDSFIRNWNEKQFSESLAVKDTRAWINGLSDLPMGLIVTRSLGEQYEILTIAVRPDWRRRGLARQLLEKAIEDAKENGATSMFLEVADDNYPAQSFYGDAEFTVISTRANYYRQPDGTYRDALVMRRELP